MFWPFASSMKSMDAMTTLIVLMVWEVSTPGNCNFLSPKFTFSTICLLFIASVLVWTVWWHREMVKPWITGKWSSRSLWDQRFWLKGYLELDLNRQWCSEKKKGQWWKMTSRVEIFCYNPNSQKWQSFGYCKVTIGLFFLSGVKKVWHFGVCSMIF